MPKITKVTLFGVDELDAGALSAAMRPLQESAYNVNYGWWERTTLKMEEMLGMVGFSSTKVDFSIRGQNSAMFTGRFSSDDTAYAKMAESYPDALAKLQVIPLPLGADMGVVKATITQVKFGGIASSMVGVVGLSVGGSQDTASETAVKAYLMAVKDALCEYIYEVFRAEYEHLCTDEALIETMRCEGMLFLADGTRAPDFLVEGAEDVLEFEDIISDGSLEGAGYLCAEDDDYVYTIHEVAFVDDGTTGYEVEVTIIDDGAFIDSKILASEEDAKLWAAKYSLGER